MSAQRAREALPGTRADFEELRGLRGWFLCVARRRPVVGARMW